MPVQIIWRGVSSRVAILTFFAVAPPPPNDHQELMRLCLFVGRKKQGVSFGLMPIYYKYISNDVKVSR
jgi:hypothetical protein